MLLLIIIVAIAVVVLFPLLLVKDKELKEARKELHSYKAVAEQAEALYDDLREKVARDSADERIIHAEYCTSDSDLIKYKTEKAMENAINSRLALLIGNDIQKFIAPSVLPLENGNKKYSYVFKVRRI